MSEKCGFSLRICSEPTSKYRGYNEHLHPFSLLAVILYKKNNIHQGSRLKIKYTLVSSVYLEGTWGLNQNSSTKCFCFKLIVVIGITLHSDMMRKELFYRKHTFLGCWSVVWKPTVLWSIPNITKP
jgi:hypothetical protein